MIKVYKNQKLYKKYPNGDMKNRLHLLLIYIDLAIKNKIKDVEIPKLADDAILATLRLN